VFTGIIEETGIVRSLRPATQGANIVIEAETIPASLKIGDSIAVSGACLTATSAGETSFSCDLSAETMKRTSLECARIGTIVNLERPLEVGARLGGHFVLGHVDGMGRLVSTKSSGEGAVMSFRYPRELARYIVFKGSITVDGISLTVASLEGDVFSIAVIPHTLRVTTLGLLKAGDPVNLEVDVLGRYFERFFQLGLLREDHPALTLDFLKEQGF